MVKFRVRIRDRNTIKAGVSINIGISVILRD
jgi:hypothetical protein